jgi:alkylated DNA repair dioxygenase AlkB
VIDRCYVYEPDFIDAQARADIVAWLDTLHPLWEQRYSTKRPPPAGKQQRGLLRPVYWLGNWQFACLGYYEPPKRIRNVAVAAEPFPPVLARLVATIEKRVRSGFPPNVVPRRWHLNTCLVNFYGSRIDGDRRIDTARVGEHRDFEPGPVASLSLGARAFFQFVTGGRTRERAAIAFQQWLDDGSLQIFGGDRWKRQLFHRVQRVDRKGEPFALHVDGFVTRRVNFTFRYVPDAHILRYAELPEGAASAVQEYMDELARHSSYFRRELDARGAPGS